MTDERPAKGKLHPEMLVGVSAVIIGVCALGVSLYETSLMREEQRAAVIPLLELGRSYNLGQATDADDKSRLWLHAENVGIGPARVLDFRVTVDGEHQTTWRAAMTALLGRDEDISYGQSTINGRTIPPDRTVRMFDLNTTGLTAELLGKFERLDFEACFCSVFDECWTTKYSTFGAASPVPTCERTEASFLE